MSSFDRLITNNPHIKQHDWDKPKEEKKTEPVVIEWIDGHKLDDVLESTRKEEIKKISDRLKEWQDTVNYTGLDKLEVESFDQMTPIKFYSWIGVNVVRDGDSIVFEHD